MPRQAAVGPDGPPPGGAEERAMPADRSGFNRRGGFGFQPV